MLALSPWHKDLRQLHFYFEQEFSAAVLAAPQHKDLRASAPLF
jgi:hypothetical protein